MDLPPCARDRGGDQRRRPLALRLVERPAALSITADAALARGEARIARTRRVDRRLRASPRRLAPGLESDGPDANAGRSSASCESTAGGCTRRSGTTRREVETEGSLFLMRRDQVVDPRAPAFVAGLCGALTEVLARATAASMKQWAVGSLNEALPLELLGPGADEAKDDVESTPIPFV